MEHCLEYLLLHMRLEFLVIWVSLYFCTFHVLVWILQIILFLQWNNNWLVFQCFWWGIEELACRDWGTIFLVNMVYITEISHLWMVVVCCKSSIAIFILFSSSKCFTNVLCLFKVLSVLNINPQVQQK